MPLAKPFALADFQAAHPSIDKSVFDVAGGRSARLRRSTSYGSTGARGTVDRQDAAWTTRLIARNLDQNPTAQFAPPMNFRARSNSCSLSSACPGRCASLLAAGDCPPCAGIPGTRICRHRRQLRVRLAETVIRAVVATPGRRPPWNCSRLARIIVEIFGQPALATAVCAKAWSGTKLDDEGLLRRLVSEEVGLAVLLRLGREAAA